MAKLAVLVPVARAHLIRYHGVLGPAAAWRRLIVPRADETSAELASGPAPLVETSIATDSESAEDPGESDTSLETSQPSSAPDDQARTTARKKKVKGHGRNGAGDYASARQMRVSLESMKPGDRCPCGQENLYETNDSPLVRIVGQAPIYADVYLQRLRCNTCGDVFTAEPPEGVGSEKYDASPASSRRASFRHARAAKSRCSFLAVNTPEKTSPMGWRSVPPNYRGPSKSVMPYHGIFHGNWKSSSPNCLVHGRRSWVEAAATFPEECRYILEILEQGLPQRCDRPRTGHDIGPTAKARPDQKAPLMMR